jgi:hypothetical protein
VPDFSWNIIPKPGEIYQKTAKYFDNSKNTNMHKDPKMYKMAINLTKFFRFEAYIYPRPIHIYQNLGFRYLQKYIYYLATLAQVSQTANNENNL